MVATAVPSHQTTEVRVKHTGDTETGGNDDCQAGIHPMTLTHASQFQLCGTKPLAVLATASTPLTTDWPAAYMTDRGQ